MRIWITKYALTEGIREVQAEIEPDGAAFVPVPGSPHKQLVRAIDVHITPADACLRMEKMKAMKLASLKRQIRRLEELKVEIG